MKRNKDLTTDVSRAGVPAPSGAERISRRPLYAPPANIVEDPESVRVFVDMPGADESSLDLTVEKDRLVIRASAPDAEPAGKGLYYAEYRPGDYERVFLLTQEIDRDKIAAEFKNGVLAVTLPKGAYARSRRIEVTTH